MELSPGPKRLEKEYKKIFTKESLDFLYNLVSEFQPGVTQILRQRKIRKLDLENPSNALPKLKEDADTHGCWKIAPLPPRLKDRRLDLGDVPPSQNKMLKQAFSCHVNGVQVDFDDAHCPSWPNQIKGIHNVIAIVRGEGGIDLDSQNSPLLIPRPRAWNMNEHNIMVNGKEVPGPLVDFGLIMFHIGKSMHEREIGPYFYLPKIESAEEAKLWNDIFNWTENAISIPHCSIKACVLIEDIVAAFDAENILYELRDHSFGLNCGMWDYTASIIHKFGSNPAFILPDRNKHINAGQRFVQDYMKLVSHICRKHDAPATGGMIPFVLKSFPSNEVDKVWNGVLDLKRQELDMGLSGFLTYDVATVDKLHATLFSAKELEILDSSKSDELDYSQLDLLQIPKGGMTKQGLATNIQVGVIFIYSWISEGKGHFVLDGRVEDSATAEISRSQVWQWIYHQVHLEDSKETVTKSLVKQLVWVTYTEIINRSPQYMYNSEHLQLACKIFMELVTSFEFPEFITTFLYNHSTFRQLQET